MESAAEPVATVDVEAFGRDGYVVVRRLVGARTLRSLRLAAEDLVHAGRLLTANAAIRGARYQVQSHTGRSEDGAVAPGVFRKITFPGAAHAAFARYRHDSRVLDVVRALGVTSPRCVVDQVNLKPPGVGTRFPWHHDAAFVTSRDQEAIARHGGVNALLAIDLADAESGALEVLAGSHHHGPRPFEYDLAVEGEESFDLSRRVMLPLAPGDAVFFHPYLVHGSGPNLTARPRRMAALWIVGGAAEA